MSSVALPFTSTTAPALEAEADLTRRAARGDEAAFNDLFRRHGQGAWRLAQAVAIDGDEAADVVGHGFARALRVARRRNQGDETFRPLLLSAVYRAAMERPRAPGAATAPLKGRKGDAALTAAAFRSLPERWRAALWLHEVEGFETDGVAAVLGVSAPVAVQLVARGQRGMVARMEQAGLAAPASLDKALSPLAATLPANLADKAAAAWRAGLADVRRSVVTGAWLSERAVRPLAMAAAGLFGLGLVGLGIVTQQSGVTTNGVSVPGTIPGHSIGVDNASTRGGGGGADSFLLGPGGTGFGSLLSLTPAGLAAALDTAGFGPAGFGSVNPAPVMSTPAVPASPPPAPSATAAPPAPTGAGSPGAATPPPSTGTPATSGGTTPPPVVSPQPITVPGVATVSPGSTQVAPTGGGGSAVNANTGGGSVGAGVASGTSGTPAVGVNVGNCTGVNVGTVKLGCTTAATTPPSPTATTTPLTPVVNGVNNAVNSTTKTLLP